MLNCVDVWVLCVCCWYVLLVEISGAGCGEKTGSGAAGCSPHAPHSLAGCASRRNDAALWRIGEGGGVDPRR